MSDSSDDDVLNLLPAGGGGGGRFGGRPGPKRNRNFAAMLNDSDSDDDVKHKPAPAAKKAAPPSDSSDSDSDASSASIKFEAAPAAAKPAAVVAMSKSSSSASSSSSSGSDIQFAPEAPKKEAAKPAPPPSSSASDASKGTQSFKAVPVAVSSPSPPPPVAASPAAVVPTPVVVVSPTPVVQPPPFVVAPAPIISSPPPVHQQQALPAPVQQYAPAEVVSPPQQQQMSSTATNLQQQYSMQRTAAPQPTPTSSYSAPPPPAAMGHPLPLGGEGQPHVGGTPMRSRAAEVRLDANVDELLARAQQRLRERQYNTTSQTANASRAASPAASGRYGTPMRGPMSSPGGAARYGSVGRPSTPSMAVPPLAPPDFSKENRTLKENQRLSDEVTFLASENNRLRNNPAASMVTAASTVEITKLELQLEMAKKQCRDVEVESQRTRRVLEEQLRDVSEHRNTLQDEIAACLKSVAQFEQMTRDKDGQLMQEQAMNLRIKTDLAEAQQEASRYRDDLNRQAIEWSAKLDRNLSLLEDMKRQRNHLTELNDKISRDKDAAVNERKKLFDDLRQSVAERNREKDEAAEEISALKRDTERYRSMLQEKERILTAQLAEERKAKDTLHAKLIEMEGSSNKGTKSLDVQLRAQQDEHRHVAQRLQDQLHQSATELRHARQEIDELRAMLGTRSERDRFDQQQEYNDHVFRLRKELDDTLVTLRTTESARDLAVRDCERAKEELKGASAIVAQWKVAKEKAEAQNHQLTTTITLLMESDDGHHGEKDGLKATLDAQDLEIRQLHAELEQTYEVEQRYKDLLEENDRLSGECGRLARERDELVDENGKMATEVLKWRDEVKDMLLRNNSKVGGGRPSTALTTGSLGYGRR